MTIETTPDALTIGERRGAAAVACTWLVCLAALYWRGV